MNDQRTSAPRRRRSIARAARTRPRATRWLLAGLLATVIALGASVAYLAPSSTGAELTLDELLATAAAGNVEAAVLHDEDARISGSLLTGGAYWAAYPRSGAATASLVEDLAASGASVSIDPQVTKANVRTAATVLLPLVLLAHLFALLLTVGRGDNAGMGAVTDFGRVGDRRAGATDVTGFADVAGVDSVVVELREIVEHLRDPGRFDSLRVEAPRGVLLAGPPGVGKTLLARAVAAEAGVPFFAVSGAEFVESLVGVGAARVRDLFRRVRAVAPAIVFIDEIDAAGRRRGAGGASGGTDEREQTLNQLLVEMDGFEPGHGIVVVAATNRPDILDPALLRPGRFDRTVEVPLPDVAARRAILSLHLQRRRTTDVDVDALAAMTAGMSGADLANLVNEAALLALRAGSDAVGDRHVRDAVSRVASGGAASPILSADERRRIALHEAGRAAVAAEVGRAAALQRVSIVARSGPLGRLVLDGDAHLHTRAELGRALVIALAGRAAEEELLGYGSTLGEDDVALATSIARDLVARYGLDEEVGPVRLVGPGDNGHLGGVTAVEPMSTALHDVLDGAVRRHLSEARAAAREIVRRRRAVVEELAEALVVAESLEGAELHGLLSPVVRDAVRV